MTPFPGSVDFSWKRTEPQDERDDLTCGHRPRGPYHFWLTYHANGIGPVEGKPASACSLQCAARVERELKGEGTQRVRSIVVETAPLGPLKRVLLVLDSGDRVELPARGIQPYWSAAARLPETTIAVLVPVATEQVAE